MTTFCVNELNNLIKDRGCQNEQKRKIQVYAIYRKCNLNSKIQID